jgi:hypothetical protein
MLYSSG